MKPTQRDIRQAIMMYARPDSDIESKLAFMKKYQPPSNPIVHKKTNCKGRNKQEEANLQIACCKLLRTLPNTLFFSVPNHLYLGNSASSGARAGYIARQKAMGMLPGVSDLIIIFRNRNGLTTVCLPELKVGANPLSENQQAFSYKAEQLGCLYSVIRSLDDLISLLRKAEHPNFK